MSLLLISGADGRTGKTLVLTKEGIKVLISVKDSDIYGLTIYDSRYYVSLRGSTSGVLQLDSSFNIVGRLYIPTSDPHCIFSRNGRLHLVSSLEDRVYSFAPDLSDLQYETFGLGGDLRFHVNDISHIDGKFFMSMFTDKADGQWDATAANGVVKVGDSISVSDSKSFVTGLVKPHNPILFKDDLWVCDSGRGAVWRGETKIFQEAGAWTRGLCVDDEYIHVGVADYMQSNGAKVVTLTHDGDIVRSLEIPLTTIFGIQSLW